MNFFAIVVLFGLMGILFHELFSRLRVHADVRQVFAVAPAALKVIRSTTLSDQDKEKAVRQMSASVFRSTLTFTAKLICILLCCMALAATAQILFNVSPDGLGALLVSWHGFISAVVIAILYTRLCPADGRENPPSNTRQYRALDRVLHRIAFIHPGLQKILGELENDLFRKQLASVEVTRPVFITGLPRAGTTLLLELLHDTGQFASFTYRQMPFVLNPLLWHRLSAASRKSGKWKERAHGDGMLISYDSPEAFEEVLWVSYLGRTIFDNDHSRPLTPADLPRSFREAYVNLVSKVMCLKGIDAREPTPSTSRYLSKNNANLSRLDAIVSVFPDAHLLVCFRHPTTQFPSLHAQHLRFLKLHRQDAFARDYMRWTGHHDFGANFVPVRFGDRIDLDPETQEFWLQYWIEAYRFVLEHAPAHAQFIGYESLLNNGAADLRQLAESLGLGDAAAAELSASSTRLRAPAGHVVPSPDPTGHLLAEAESIYRQLMARSVAQGYAGVNPVVPASAAAAPEMYADRQT